MLNLIDFQAHTELSRKAFLALNHHTPTTQNHQHRALLLNRYVLFQQQIFFLFLEKTKHRFELKLQQIKQKEPLIYLYG